MRKHLLSFLIVVCIPLSFADGAEIVLFEAMKGKPDSLHPSDNQVKIAFDSGMMQIATAPTSGWPGVTLKGNWAFPQKTCLVLEVENLTDKSTPLNCRLDSTGADSNKRIATFQQSTTLAPHEKKYWEVALPVKLSKALEEKLFGMRGYPGGIRGDTDGKMNVGSFDPNDVIAVLVFFGNPTEAYSVGVRRILITSPKPNDTKISSLNDALDLPPEKFFPMIDRYGQYIHANWHTKISSDSDIKHQVALEEADMKEAAHMAPQDRNKYGGWTGGPQLKATGRFYTTKQNGKWWLVDPEGRLFWSHGVNCTKPRGQSTPITDREHLFTEFPFESCFSTGSGGAHGYYANKKNYRLYEFALSNQMLKYGDNWESIVPELTHKRLASWGLNTIGNWSELAICKMEKTPYTGTLNAAGPDIEASQGYWGKFKDPFHSNFCQSLASQISQQGTADDPWCIGYFVDNELGWGDDTSLVLAALSSPKTQPAKLALLDMLKSKYKLIDDMNAAWKTAYRDWDALLEATTLPEKRNWTPIMKEDFQQGYHLIAEKYFDVIKRELKKAAPNALYLGCRFAWGNASAMRASAKYCDVIGINKYAYHVDDFKLPEGVDLPVVIGEFHFGALDRGLFHTGLRPTDSQDARAAAYQTYLRSCLAHPNIVGAHWFLYRDEPTTGRSLDGENYQVGLVDICDTPYWETIEAFRQIGREMYRFRTAQSR